MRWDDLFTDLEARAAHEHRQEFEAEVADRRLRDVATVALADRLVGTCGSPGSDVALQLPDGAWVSGAVRDVGLEWVLLLTPRQVLVPLAAVTAVRGLAAISGPPTTAVRARRTFLLAVRALSGAAVTVLVRTRAADVRGRLERVGADHVDVVTATGPRTVLTVPFAAVLSIAEAG